MKDICHICKKERDGKWALLFGPPNKGGFTQKDHVCPECWKIVRYMSRELRRREGK